MKTIEVTKETFYKLFEELNPVNTATKELYRDEYYFDITLEQTGFARHNFTSNVVQYYLIDINS